jgi:tRNA threonylcarbamoyladenosine biosynthesis protein TsaB
MLLAIDTSTKQAGIALYDGARGLIAEYNWHSANRHTEELMPAVAQMLAQASAKPSGLRAVAVALGPGSFTGLRVGLAAAKGLALANDLTLLGIPTLDTVAYPHQAQPVPVVAVLQAGRGRVYWAPYAHGPGGWAAQEPPRLSTVPELANTVVRPLMFVGEVSTADRETLISWAGRARANFLPSALSLRRAGYLAELGWRRFDAGEADDPAALSPIYLQQPDGTFGPGPAAIGGTP